MLIPDYNSIIRIRFRKPAEKVHLLDNGRKIQKNKKE